MKEFSIHLEDAIESHKKDLHPCVRPFYFVDATSFPTANAYVADVTLPEQRARAFGWIGSALSLGFLGGPVLDGLLAGIDLRLGLAACPSGRRSALQRYA